MPCRCGRASAEPLTRPGPAGCGAVCALPAILIDRLEGVGRPASAPPTAEGTSEG